MDYSTDSVTRYIKQEEKSLEKTKKDWFQFFKDHTYFLVWFIILFLLSYFLSFLSPAPEQTHFVDLATSFLKGHLYVMDPSRLFDDTAVFNGHTYIYYNPLPAILLMPFVFLFKNSFHQAYLMPLFTVINFLLIYRIGIKSGMESKSSFWVALGMIFGSIYLLLSWATITSYYVQVIGFTFLLAAVDEYLGPKRWWLMGLYVGLAGATRMTLLLGSIFFLLELLRLRLSFRHKLPLLFDFMIPIIVIVIALGEYNFMRFGKIGETGYSYQINQNPIYTTARQSGLFSLSHIPGNLYFFLLRGPDAVRADEVSYVLKPPYLRVNEWGLGLFFTSPIFLYLLMVKRNQAHLVSSLITVFFMLMPVLMYFGVGVWQYGYRYALDFYPFLLLLLFPAFNGKLPLLAKGMIIVSIFFTMFYMYSIWHIYPTVFFAK